jgi:hypothetical protein
MKTRPTVEQLIYVVIIVLALIALAMLALAPKELIETAPVYKAF